MRRRFAVLAAGTLVTTACLGLAVGPQARSDILGPSSTFTATAEGDGLDVEIDYPGALPDSQLGFGQPVGILGVPRQPGYICGGGGRPVLATRVLPARHD